MLAIIHVLYVTEHFLVLGIVCIVIIVFSLILMFRLNFPRNIIFAIVSVISIAMLFIGGTTYSEHRDAIEIATLQPQLKELQSHKYYLKEMTQKDLLQGEIKGSFLLISGSIYGKIEEKMYLVVIYLDDNKNVHKITKFNLEELEIVTIESNESAYFRYDNSHIDRWIELEYGVPRLYLPEGWNILEK